MRGWRGRSMVGPDDALLLDRTRSIHTFGMRFPISAVLLDRQLVVRSVRPVRPGRLVLPRPGTRHVLECAEGVDLRPGDRLRILGAGEGASGRRLYFPALPPGRGRGAA